jgi:hypothetical protein
MEKLGILIFGACLVGAGIVLYLAYLRLRSGRNGD